MVLKEGSQMEENKDLQTVDTDRKEKKSFSDKIKSIKLKGKNSKRPPLPAATMLNSKK